MQNYLEVTFSKLASYMHERFNEINKNIPIFIAAYRLDDSIQPVKVAISMKDIIRVDKEVLLL